MSIFDNPHPPFVSTNIEIEEQPSLCDLGCAERFIPKFLRNNELFKKVDFLMCYYERDPFTEESLKDFFNDLGNFFRKGNPHIELLNWYSVLSWLDVSDYNWEDSIVYSGSKNFYERYKLSNSETWLLLSKSNGEEFNEKNMDFWNWILEPYVGTNLIQRKIIQKLRVSNGKVIDWYENNDIVNSYSFLFEEFPGWEKAQSLIIASKLLKNAESILIALKDKRCPDRFILSYSDLDKDYLSDITALKFEGVHICFQRYNYKLINLLDIDKFLEVLFSVTRYRSELIDYWNKKFLSDNLFLDDFSDRMAMRTHTTIHPIWFVQLMPAYVGTIDDWGPLTKWEEWYVWGNIDINNLVKKRLKYETKFQEWPSTVTWENEEYDWVGDKEDWKYYKPTKTLGEYWENRNLIPGYEPWSGASLYEVEVISKKETIFLGDVVNKRSKLIKYWEEYLLSNNIFISAGLDRPPELRKVVVSGAHISIGPNGGPRSLVISIPDINVMLMRTGINLQNVNFYETYNLSDNLSLDGLTEKVVYGKHTISFVSTSFGTFGSSKENENLKKIRNKVIQKSINKNKNWNKVYKYLSIPRKLIINDEIVDFLYKIMNKNDKKFGREKFNFFPENDLYILFLFSKENKENKYNNIVPKENISGIKRIIPYTNNFNNFNNNVLNKNKLLNTYELLTDYKLGV